MYNSFRAKGKKALPISCCFAATLLAGSNTVLAGEKIDPSKQTEIFLQVRERAEYQDNFNDKSYGAQPQVGDSSDAFLVSRIRLGVKHQFNEQFAAQVSMQDSRALGWALNEEEVWARKEFAGIEHNPQDDPLELGATWLQYEANGFNARIGRQLIGYGNERVVAASNWKNSGSWVWDAVRAGYKNGAHWIDGFYGESMVHDPDVFSSNHRHGYVGAGMYGHVQVNDALALEPLLISKYNDNSLEYEEKNFLYCGARVFFELSGFSVDATYVQQGGTVTTLDRGEVDSDAQGINLDMSYRLNPQWSLGTTFSFASGDDKTTDDIERFDASYGAADKYYGRINLIRWSNMMDYGLTANYRPFKGLNIRGEVHQFYADQINDKWLSYKTGLDASDDEYGNEIDLVAKFKMNPTWSFAAGASVFMPGNAIEEAVAHDQEDLTDDTAYTGFFQVTYSMRSFL
jgi:hypothetical protein